MSGIFSKYSLRLRLMLLLSLVAVLIWLGATATAWYQARKEINELFDMQQILLAKRLASTDLKHILIERKKRGGFHEQIKLPSDYDEEALSFAIFTAQGDLLLADEAKGRHFIFAPEKGFSHVKPRGEENIWRIFWLPSADGRLFIAVGQEMDYREDLVEKVVFSQLWIWLASLPLLITFIILLINKELKTLAQIQDQMEQRLPEDHSPLNIPNMPSEIKPLIVTLNQFFNRTSTQLLRERRFTSDAAHELRSPLAGLRIQAELAQLASDDEKMRQTALANLMQGIDRTTQLIEQLLLLSRLDTLSELTDLEPIDWQNMLISLINELQSQAEGRGIFFSMSFLDNQQNIQGQPILIRLMLRNLLENAIKYVQSDSEVKVVLQQDQLTIEDNGGGVDEEDLIKLGQRFYRPSGQNEKGSGLGLSIVFRIAELHGYKVRLENTQNLRNQKGLRVIIQFLC
ncbi:MAG: quorum sensing histidine kinase QseC [Lonepinella koalarum]|nr:quorum sensing histidine kinase QseC [Lonepinella koalarum]